MPDNSSFFSKTSSSAAAKRKLENSDSGEKESKIQCLLNNTTFSLPIPPGMPVGLDASCNGRAACHSSSLDSTNGTGEVLFENCSNGSVASTSRKRSRDIEDMEVDSECCHSEPKLARTSLDATGFSVKPVEESIAEALHLIHTCDPNIKSSVDNALMVFMKKKRQIEDRSIFPQPQLATFTFAQAEEFITGMMTELEKWLQEQYMTCLNSKSRDQHLNFVNFNNDNLLRQDQRLDFSQLPLEEEQEQLDYMR